MRCSGGGRLVGWALEDFDGFYFHGGARHGVEGEVVFDAGEFGVDAAALVAVDGEGEVVGFDLELDVGPLVGLDAAGAFLDGSAGGRTVDEEVVGAHLPVEGD